MYHDNETTKLTVWRFLDIYLLTILDFTQLLNLQEQNYSHEMYNNTFK